MKNASTLQPLHRRKKNLNERITRQTAWQRSTERQSLRDRKSSRCNAYFDEAVAIDTPPIVIRIPAIVNKEITAFVLKKLKEYNIDLLVFASLCPNLIRRSIMDQNLTFEGVMQFFDYSTIPTIIGSRFSAVVSDRPYPIEWEENFSIWLGQHRNEKYLGKCYSSSLSEEDSLFSDEESSETESTIYSDAELSVGTVYSDFSDDEEELNLDSLFREEEID